MPSPLLQRSPASSSHRRASPSFRNSHRKLQGEEQHQNIEPLEFIALIRNGDIKAVKQILDGCPTEDERLQYVNATGRRGQSALVIAIRSEYPNLVRLLLKMGAKTTFECNFPEPGTTPLRVAFETGRPNLQTMICECFLQDQLEAGYFIRLNDLGMYFKPGQTVARECAERVLIKTYANCELDQIVEILSPLFPENPAQTMLDVLRLAGAMEREAVRIKSLQPLVSAELRTGSVQWQLIAAGMLNNVGTVKDGLGRFECDELLRCPKGLDTMRLSLQCKLKVFVAQPCAQAYVRREWYGPLTAQVLDDDNNLEFVEQIKLAVIWMIAFLTNAALVVPCGLFPFLETFVYNSLLEDTYVREADKEVSKTSAQEVLIREGESDSNKTRLSKLMDVAETVGGSVGGAVGAVGGAVGAVGGAVGELVSGLVGGGGDAGGRSMLVSREALHTGNRAQEKLAHRAQAVRHRTDPNSANTAGPKSTRAGCVRALDLYLMRTPLFKFSMRVIADISLAGLVIVFSDYTISQSYGNLAMFIWSVAGCISEYSIIAPDARTLRYELLSFFSSDKPSIYRSNALNILDFVTFHLLVVASALRLAGDEVNGVALWSFCGVCSGLRLLRMLMMFPSLGPLVLMLIQMIVDVLKMLVLDVFVLAAIASGLFILYNAFDPNSGRTSAFATSDHCAGLISLAGDASSFPVIFFVLLNGAIREEFYFECLMDNNELQGLVWFYYFSFVLITVVLLLNMLIAMMAKTFDHVWEASEVNYQFLFARLVISQQQRPPTPPPLNLLHAPTSIIATVVRLLARLVGGPLMSASEFLDASFEYSTVLLRSHSSPWLQLNVVTDKGPRWGEYKGTETPWNQRNSWNAWKHSMSDVESADAVLNFCVQHQDDGVDEQWRSKLAKQITAQTSEIQEQIRQLTLQMQGAMDAKQGLAGVSTSSTMMTPAMSTPGMSTPSGQPDHKALHDDSNDMNDLAA